MRSGSSASALEFDLVHSPFRVLGAEPEDSQARIAELHDEAQLDPTTDPAALDRARDTLSKPISRLGAEVAWFVELDPRERTRLLAAVTRFPLDEAINAAESAPPLARANAAAHLCGRFPGQTSPIRSLIEAWSEVEPEDVLNCLSRIRRAATLPRIDPAHLDSALASLKSAHARAARRSIEATGDGSAVMLDFVEEAIASDEATGLIEGIVRDYDSATEAELIRIRERIEAAIAACRKDSADAGAHVAEIDRLLIAWDVINQPVQRLEQAQGHEEPRSAALARDIRGLALHLANNHGRHEHALALTDALLRTFPELETVAEGLARDSATLGDLVEQAKVERALAPLIAEIEDVSRNLQVLRTELCNGGSPRASTGLAKLLAALDQALRDPATLEHREMAFALVRSLAIDLHNEHGDSEAALQLLEHLCARPYPSDETARRLEEDRKTARLQALWGELKRSVDTPSAALPIIDRLLPLVAGDERASLSQLKQRLERKRLSTRVRWLVGLGALAFFGWIVVEDDLAPERPPSRASTGLTAPLPTAPQSPVASDISRTESRSPSPVSFEEAIPPSGRDRVLGRSEIRYCLYQGERLDILRSLANELEIPRFNLLVDDYNSRCASFQYRPGILEAVESEVASRRSILRADAERIRDGWRQPIAQRAPSQPSGPTPPVGGNPPGSLLNIYQRDDARRVQRRLTELGFPTGGIDGIWGADSRSALRSFKLNHPRLPADEVWDLETQRFLNP